MNESGVAVQHDAQIATADAVLAFWFETLSAKDWFRKSGQLDIRIAERFATTLAAAERGELAAWNHDPRARLAQIIVLDQFSRNIHRDTAAAFANDPRALELAEELVACGADRELSITERIFAYMPYMHSESLEVHQQALRVYDQPGLEKELGFEQRHYDILRRFGRYPHRNFLLGRSNTDEETAFLAEPGSSF